MLDQRQKRRFCWIMYTVLELYTYEIVKSSVYRTPNNSCHTALHICDWVMSRPWRDSVGSIDPPGSAARRHRSTITWIVSCWYTIPRKQAHSICFHRLIRNTEQLFQSSNRRGTYIGWITRYLAHVGTNDRVRGRYRSVHRNHYHIGRTVSNSVISVMKERMLLITLRWSFDSMTYSLFTLFLDHCSSYL